MQELCWMIYSELLHVILKPFVVLALDMLSGAQGAWLQKLRILVEKICKSSGPSLKLKSVMTECSECNQLGKTHCLIGKRLSSNFLHSGSP